MFLFNNYLWVDNNNYKQTLSMTSPDLRKRLFSLKNMTEDLKNYTHNSSFNISHIRSLISNLKEVSQEYPNQASSQLYRDSRLENEGGLSHLENESVQDENSVLFKPKRNVPRQQASHQQQIISLRQQNLRLEQQLSLLRSQLAKKQQSKSNNQQSNQKKVPYFKQQETLNVFVCRFQIAEDDYPKIEYRPESVSLGLDRLGVPHKDKGSLQQFDLTTLQKVQYLPFNVIVYHFQQFISHVTLRQPQTQAKGQLTHVFVKYNSAEQLKKWDLSMYVNFQLVKSMNQKQLFFPYFEELKIKREEQQYRQKWNQIKDSEEVSTSQQKWLLQEFRKKRQQFVQIKNIIQQKLHIPKENVQNNTLVSNQQLLSPEITHSQQNNNAFQSIMKPFNLAEPNSKQALFQESKEPSNQQYKQGRNQNVRIQNKIQPPINNSEHKNGQEGRQVQIDSDQHGLRRQHAISFSKQQEFPNYFQRQGAEIKNSAPKNRLPSFSQTIYSTSKPNTKLQIQENRMNRSDSQHQPVKRLSVVQQKVSSARKSLQNGYRVIKYSKDGFSPHQKKIFLSLDCKKLCWSEKDKDSEYKSIPLEVIIKVDYGTIGGGIAKHVKKLDPLEYYCVIEYYTGDYKKKTIQLKGQTPQQMKSFSEQLKVILDYSKGVSLNALVAS